MYLKREGIHLFLGGRNVRANVEHRLSRKESQSQTRARLIAVGREHFLRDGLGGAVAERIAADAGFSRGAFYANFANKDALFLAVLREGRETRLLDFRQLMAGTLTPAEEFARLREAIGRSVSEPHWVSLQAEFQAHALRSSAIREAYVAEQQKQRQEGAELLQQFRERLNLKLSGTPEEVMELLASSIEGLALRHMMLGGVERERAGRLAILCFDQLIGRVEEATR